MNQLARAGASPEKIAELVAEWHEAKGDIELCLDADELSAVRIFHKSQTQWTRNDTTGQPVGLDYSKVEVVARIVNIPLTESVLECLQIMEHAALLEWSQRSDRANRAARGKVHRR